MSNRPPHILYLDSHDHATCLEKFAGARRFAAAGGWQIVRLKIDSDGRSLIFGDVICRVSPTAGTACHLDTDEANAAGCSGEVYGEVIL